MVVWHKAAWIPALFAALDAIAPQRDRGTDGTIGDLAHASGTSGHNPDDTPGVKAERQDADARPEVRAADASSRLRHPTLTMQDVVNALLADTPAARRDRARLIYIIYAGHIWRAANGWRRETYTGSDRHYDHIHVSGHPDADDDGAPFASILALGDDMIDMNQPIPGIQGLTVGQWMVDVWVWEATVRGLGGKLDADGLPTPRPDDRFKDVPTFPRLILAALRSLDGPPPAPVLTPEQLQALGDVVTRQLAAELAGDIEAAAERAVRRVLGALDGATPPASPA